MNADVTFDFLPKCLQIHSQHNLDYHRDVLAPASKFTTFQQFLDRLNVITTPNCCCYGTGDGRRELWWTTCYLDLAKKRGLHTDCRFLDRAQRLQKYFDESGVRHQELEWRACVEALMADAASSAALPHQTQSFVEAQCRAVQLFMNSTEAATAVAIMQRGPLGQDGYMQYGTA